MKQEKNDDGEAIEHRSKRLRLLAELLDSSIAVPGTPYRIGLDPIIGLIPGIGDALTTAVSFYIVLGGALLGASKWTLARMLTNCIIDAGIGAVPLIGDIFDFGWKANSRNIRLLERATVHGRAGSPLQRITASVLIVVVVGLATVTGAVAIAVLIGEALLSR